MQVKHDSPEHYEQSARMYEQAKGHRHANYTTNLKKEKTGK